jgi:hypothetical protein
MRLVENAIVLLLPGGQKKRIVLGLIPHAPGADASSRLDPSAVRNPSASCIQPRI